MCALRLGNVRVWKGQQLCVYINDACTVGEGLHWWNKFPSAFSVPGLGGENDTEWHQTIKRLIIDRSASGGPPHSRVYTLQQMCRKRGSVLSNKCVGSWLMRTFLPWTVTAKFAKPKSSSCPKTSDYIFACLHTALRLQVLHQCSNRISYRW